MATSRARAGFHGGGTLTLAVHPRQASLRQRVSVQEAQVRRLEAQSERGSSRGDDSDDDAGNDGGDSSYVGEHRPPRRRLSVSVALRSPGSGPLMISPMQTPVMTPRSSTPRSEASTPRRGSGNASGADAGGASATRLYELQADIASLRCVPAVQLRACAGDC